MADAKQVSPLLDGFTLGETYSSHHGVTCTPALYTATKEKYILKHISIPESQRKVDALLLSGSCADREEAQRYYDGIAQEMLEEVRAFQKLARTRAAVPFQGFQLTAKTGGEVGADLWILSPYRTTLTAYWKHNPMTHLAGVNLGLDLCAALTLCRKAGYLYQDLRPENIAVTEQRSFQLMDIGMVRLDSLSSATFPPRFCSDYTPPELRQDFAEPNGTIDTYAVGQILYRVFSGGNAPGNPADPPAYAAEELAQIICKAISPEMEHRWQSPEEMGQALISYLQRNCVNDSPIVDEPEERQAPQEPEEIPQVMEPEEAPKTMEPEQPRRQPAPRRAKPDLTLPPRPEEAPKEAEPDLTMPRELAEREPVAEPEMTLPQQPEEEPQSFEPDLTLPQELRDALQGAGAGFRSPQEELSSELERALREKFPPEPDELDMLLPEVKTLLGEKRPAPPPVRRPARQPEQATTPARRQTRKTEPEPPATPTRRQTRKTEPEPPATPTRRQTRRTEPEPPATPTRRQTRRTEPAATPTRRPIRQTEPAAEYADREERAPRVRSRRPKRNLPAVLAVLLAVVLLGAAACYYYAQVYCLPIDTLQVLEAGVNTLSVQVSSDADPALLHLTCKDTYGNSFQSDVTDGKATFTGLSPDTQYTITVMANGFHKVTGASTLTHSTAAQTNIVSFTAISGPEDGSVILNFTPDGLEPETWLLTYHAEQEQPQTRSFSGHSVTVTGLTVGKEYTFSLQTQDTPLTGQTSLTYRAEKVLLAKNLALASCAGDTMTVSWEAPVEGITGWTARCYNSSGFDVSVEVTECTATFTGLTPDSAYTIEVTAAGMTQNAWISVTARPITVTGFTLDTAEGGGMQLSWEYVGSAPQDGWVLMYATTPDAESMEAIPTTESSAVIRAVLPGATYYFQLQAAGGTTVAGGSYQATAPETAPYDHNGVRPDMLAASLFLPPEDPSWVDWGITDYQKQTVFAPGSKIGFILQAMDWFTFDNPEDEVSILIAIRDQDGKPETYTWNTLAWRNIWNNACFYGEIDGVPETPGEYKLEIYFDGGLLQSIPFTVEAE